MYSQYVSLFSLPVCMVHGVYICKGCHVCTVGHGLLQSIVVDSARGSPDKALYLWSDAPRFEVSTAPLADKEGQAVQLLDTLRADHALFLSDQQVSLCLSLSRQGCQPLWYFCSSS